LDQKSFLGYTYTYMLATNIISKTTTLAYFGTSVTDENDNRFDLHDWRNDALRDGLNLFGFHQNLSLQLVGRRQLVFRCIDRLELMKQTFLEKDLKIISLIISPNHFKIKRPR
jgi:hypothetical protein